jgi:hypothetical protein
MAIEPTSHDSRKALLRRRARGGNTKVNLLILVVVLVGAGVYLYNARFRALTDDELRAVILNRATATATNTAKTVDLTVTNLKLTNAAAGSPVPKTVEITGDLRGKDPKTDNGTIKGTYETNSRRLHLDLQFRDEIRELDSEYGSDRD